jgi:hypothetical protein
MYKRHNVKNLVFVKFVGSNMRSLILPTHYFTSYDRMSLHIRHGCTLLLLKIDQNADIERITISYTEGYIDKINVIGAINLR